MKTVVYRIQDKEGRGPYRPGFSHRWTDESVDESTRPAFYVEFGMDVLNKALVGQSCGCAFRSIAQLKQWFTGLEIHRLYSLGYAITKMEVDDVLAESEKQLVIARNKPLHSGVKRLLLINTPEYIPPPVREG